MRWAAVAAAIAAAATPALARAETQVLTLRYTCDRDLSLPVTIVNAPDQSVAVMSVDGWQITLFGEPAASGARYGWPSGGAGYVLWTKGQEATVYWREGGAETPFLTCLQEM